MLCSVVRCGFNKDKMMNMMYVGASFITSDLQCVPIILARTTGLTFIRQGFWDSQLTWSPPERVGR